MVGQHQRLTQRNIPVQTCSPQVFVAAHHQSQWIGLRKNLQETI